MSSRFAILLAAALLAASPLLSTSWQSVAASPHTERVPMYDYGTVYVSRTSGVGPEGQGYRVGFGLELGPNQSWHFHASGRVARLVAAANETAWEPELLDADGDAFANAMLNDLKLHPDKLTSIYAGLHELGSYGWEVFQVQAHEPQGYVRRYVYHVRRMEMRPPLMLESKR